MRRPVDVLFDRVEWEEIEGGAVPGEDGLPVATHRGVLRIFEQELICYQLSDGQRIIDAESFERFMTGGMK